MGKALLYILTGIQAIFLPLLEWFGKRAIIYSTVVTAFGAATAFLANQLQSMVAQMLASTVTDSFGIGEWIGLLIPSNFALCVALLINCSLAKVTYDYLFKLYTLAKT